MREPEPYFDRETGERLLDGFYASPETAALAHLLARASAPGLPHELSGQDDAVMAFRAATRSRKAGSSWRKLLTFKVIAAGLVTATVGGLAFASTTGILPAPFDLRPEPIGTTPSKPPASSGIQTSPTPQAIPGHSASPGQPSHGPNTEAMKGLCAAYLNKPPSERGKALQSPAFSDLVTAAGSPENVDAYCTALVDGKTGGQPSPPGRERP